MAKHDEFADLVKHFRKTFPEITFKVRRCKIVNNMWGYCDKIEDRYNICISSSLCLTAQKLVLIHEMGHALSYDKDKHSSDHGPIFGAAYAKCWRAYLEWLDA
jgi:Zn-dependent peptidase ImmA (M78 family)